MATLTILRQQAGAWAGVQRLRLARLRSSIFIRNVGILSGGSAIGHAFTLAVAPILTRIYGPSDFGALGLFTSFLSIAGVAVALQYEFSIVSSRDEVEAEYLTLASLLLAPPASMAAGGVLWLLVRHSVLGFGGLPWHAPVLLALALCFLGVFTALRYWCLRKEQFGQVSQGVIVQSAGRAMFQTALGAAGFHATGLLFGEAAGRCVGMSRMFGSAWPMLRRRLIIFHWEHLKQALWRNWKFPLYSLPSSVLDALCIGLTVPLLIQLYGASVGGHYSLVWRAITVPSALVTLAIADTFHTRVASCGRETPDQVLGLFKRTTVSLLVLGCIPAMVLWLWGVPLFRLIFGAEWALAGAIAAAVVPWYLAKFVVSPLSRVVVVFSGQEVKLIWDVLCLGSLLTVFFTARWRGWAPLQTIRILSFVNTGLYVVYYLLLVWMVTSFKEIGSVPAGGA